MSNLTLPKKFCREYAKLQGSSQLITFMATVLKVKPLMDAWVKKEKFKEFKRICKKYKLYIKPSAIFTEINDPSLEKNAIGGHTLTTTKAVGYPPEANINGVLHVFISSSKTYLERGFKNGWYPLVIKNRVIQKPYIDLIKFGYDLGYPDCCIKFFQKYNDWRFYSHLYEIFKNTKGEPSFLANPLTRLTSSSSSYVSHLPCSFNCRKTISYSKKLRSLIQKREPEFIEKVDKILKGSFLVFYEDCIYGFEGKFIKNHLFYQRVHFLGTDQAKNLFQEEVIKGDNLLVKKRQVLIFKGKTLQKRLLFPKTEKKPTIPFLISFQ